MTSSVNDDVAQHDENNTMKQEPQLQSTDFGWNTFNQVNFFKSAATIPPPPSVAAPAVAAISAENRHDNTPKQQLQRKCILETTDGKPSKPSAIFHPTYNQNKDVNIDIIDIDIDLVDIQNKRRSKETPSKYPSLLTVPRDEDMSVISNITSSTCMTTNSSSRLDLNKILDDSWSPDFLTRRRNAATTQRPPHKKAAAGNQQKIRAVEEMIIFFDDTTTEDTDSDIGDDIEDYGHYCSSGDGFDGLVSSRLAMGSSCGKNNNNNNNSSRISKKSTTAKKSTLFQLPSMEESMDAFFFSLYDILKIDDAVVSACRDDVFVHEEPIIKPAAAEAFQDDEDFFPVKEIHTKTSNRVVPHTEEKVGDESTTELKYKHTNHHMKKEENLTEKNHSMKRDGVLASKSMDEEISCDSQAADHACPTEREEGTVERTIWNRVQRTFSRSFGNKNATAVHTAHSSHPKKNLRGGINIIDESFKTEMIHVDRYMETPPKRQTITERIGSSLFAGITNLRKPTQKKQKAKQQKNKFRSLLWSDKQRHTHQTNEKDEQTKEATTATTRNKNNNNNNPSRMSKIILSTTGYDNASTTVITIDATYNTHEIDSESYVTPDSATSSEFYHHQQQQQQQQQQYAAQLLMA